MALKTRSKFYFGVEILPGQTFVDFNDGTNVTAELAPRSYALSRIIQELQRVLNDASTLNFSVTVNRVTRICTISANANFTLRLATGPNAANSALRALGFTQGTDLTGASSYQGAVPVGIEYKPQFFLLDYRPSTSRQEAVEATVNETGSGKAEIVKYGSRKFVGLTIDFVTNQVMPTGSYIESDSQGYEKLVEFLQWCIDKKEVEFMSDRDDVATFEVLQLESTAVSNLGIGYEIQEKAQYPDFFTSGALRFRVI